MNAAEFRSRLRAGRPLLGTLLVSPSPFWPKVIADCPLDCVFIDTEHIAIQRENLSWMCRCYAGMGLPPLVRIPSPDPDDATVAFDDGAAAVVAPYVEEPAQVRSLHGAAHWRPLKGRRREEALAGNLPEEPLLGYIRERTAGNSLVINVESVPAMENLEALLDVDGADAVLVGPHDLSCSLGHPEDYTHPAFLAAVERIAGRARSHGIGAGIHYWGSLAEQKRFHDMGCNLLFHKADAIFLREGLQEQVGALREALGLDGREPPETALDI